MLFINVHVQCTHKLVFGYLVCHCIVIAIRNRSNIDLPVAINVLVAPLSGPKNSNTKYDHVACVRNL